MIFAGKLRKFESGQHCLATSFPEPLAQLSKYYTHSPVFFRDEDEMEGQGLESCVLFPTLGKVRSL